MKSFNPCNFYSIPSAILCNIYRATCRHPRIIPGNIASMPTGRSGTSQLKTSPQNTRDAHSAISYCDLLRNMRDGGHWCLSLDEVKVICIAVCPRQSSTVRIKHAQGFLDCEESVKKNDKVHLCHLQQNPISVIISHHNLLPFSLLLC